MRIRFSLRIVLIFLTVASILAFRYSQRRNLQLAGQEIEEMGGTVFHGWQEPYVINLPTSISPYGRQIEVPYITVGPNGEQITKTRIEIASGNRGRGVITDMCKARPTHTSPGFSFSGFILGSHDDVNIDAISLPAASVNEGTVKTFNRLHNLKIVVLCVDEDYFRAELEKTRSTEEHPKTVQVYGSLVPPSAKDLERATAVLEGDFPDVELFRRGLTRDAG